jgi:hypothetical protein
MVRQQLQSSLGISSFKDVETYRTNRKPDRASERSIFFSSLYLVYPVSSDRLALNKNSVVHNDVPSVSGRDKLLPQKYTRGVKRWIASSLTVALRMPIS